MGISADSGWRNGEAGDKNAGVKSPVPDRDGEICCAECKRAREEDGVNATETVKRCQCPRVPSVITTSLPDTQHQSIDRGAPSSVTVDIHLYK